ncbi:hypothetical protein ALP58_02543 [Pseudomonas savastanoi]|uniref:Uncharacterized protein n=2 Tax=Pseudomonas syringae group TaxID=136849 RepID=A0A0P9N853_PSESX|nr:Uncharacterized protein ALO79_02646 [Pseudomonas syringae pv. castaneae]KWS95504.1 hypothetical protein AL048_20995 [Pseudomonas syringae pv. castaneae]RMS88942.1 hypothetical protein ALP58_02543 [Pseudomonas savastanoi]
MHLLNTYDTKDDADDAAVTLKGSLRVASERDDTTTIYNLFGEATWANLYSLKMYNLVKLKDLLGRRSQWTDSELEEHGHILRGLETVAKKYQLTIPSHWK